VCFSQSSFVYKRNSLGQLEVYQSQGGLPTGTPIYKIKKNVYGYLEVESVDVSTDPFTRKPDYAAYNNFKPYQLPAKEIFETLETLNKRYEFDNVTSGNAKQNSKSGEHYIDKYFENRFDLAETQLNFYNSNISFPTKLNNGWYDVVKIFDDALAKMVNPTKSKNFIYGICKVENNRIIEYYENCHYYDVKTAKIFKKINIDVSSSISNCKSTYRAVGENQYFSLYFLDNILDETKQIGDPNFGFYTIYTSSNFNLGDGIFLYFGVNKTLNRQEIQSKTPPSAYSSGISLLNPVENNCKSSFSTFAFRKTGDKFSIAAAMLNQGQSYSSIWLINDFSVIPDECKSTILNK